MELFRQTNIDFLRWKWWAIGASWALILVGLLAIFVQKGLKFGIDFAGGTQIALRFGSRPDIDHLRKLLDAGNFGDTGIQRYEAVEKNEVLIRVQQQKKEGRDITSEVLALLRQGTGSPADASRIDLNTQGRDSLAGRLTVADPDHVVAEKYGTWKKKSMYGKTFMGLARTTFLIDGTGTVVAIVDTGITPVPDLIAGREAAMLALALTLPVAAFMFAAQQGDIESARLLLAAGVRPLRSADAAIGLRPITSPVMPSALSSSRIRSAAAKSRFLLASERSSMRTSIALASPLPRNQLSAVVASNPSKLALALSVAGSSID